MKQLLIFFLIIIYKAQLFYFYNITLCNLALDLITSYPITISILFIIELIKQKKDAHAS